VVERASQQFQNTPQRVRAGPVDPVFGCKAGKVACPASGAFGIPVEQSQKRTGPGDLSVTVLATVHGAIEQALKRIALFSNYRAAALDTNDHCFLMKKLY
jgi:hypothetical protein